MKFISDRKMHINITFLGDWTLEQMIKETQDYIRENRNNPKLYADMTGLPDVKIKYRLVKSNLW